MLGVFLELIDFLGFVCFLNFFFGRDEDFICLDLAGLSSRVLFVFIPMLLSSLLSLYFFLGFSGGNSPVVLSSLFLPFFYDDWYGDDGEMLMVFLVVFSFYSFWCCFWVILSSFVGFFLKV